ncbi:MAG: amidophosphoribosyltransferase [Patescibacteria group bacterium]
MHAEVVDPFTHIVAPFFPEEKCGVFGVYGAGMEAARLVHSGLWALQHRGQESSGIASSEGKTIRLYKGEGLISRVFNEDHLALLSGNYAIGHNRYATSGGSGKTHAQPILGKHNLIALAHNGNLPDTSALEKYLKKQAIDISVLNDSEMMQAAIEHELHRGNTIKKTLKKLLPLFTGVYCLLLLTKDSLIAIRDPSGVRPLSLGKLNGGYVFSSETCALDTIGATFVRDIAPGEMVVVTAHGLKSHQLQPGDEKLDIFEFIYFARSDSMLLGKRVDVVRKNLGRQLARETDLAADVVIPVPDSAVSAAIGFAQESSVPFDHGLIKNRYIHRTFIQPAQRLREKTVNMKLNPIPESISGKRVAIIDDSIVRGTTAKSLVERVRSAGAAEVHLLISSPPVVYPDFYGIDTPRQTDLIAFEMPIKKIVKYVGADSLHFLSYQGMIKAIELPESTFCTSCFTGKYPSSIGKRSREIKSCAHSDLAREE